MKIIINNISISYKIAIKALLTYLEKHENTIWHKDGGIFNMPYDEHLITQTGKYPKEIDTDFGEFFIKCRKTKTAYIFDIWKK